ncbi:MAG TPA: hypothetical protein PLX07_13115 [Microthrixaceae bacterium]|nr:hypothetical protein [Microthrixaceae bacterium]HNH94423.1 hypothetical protein [Microthrixaceae bacterium]
MTATTPQGWVVIQSLRDQLAGRVDPCQVYACPPGDKDATAEVAWFGGVDSGSVEVPVLQDGRKQRNESVAGVLNVNIAGRSDLTSAQSRAIEVAAEFMDLFADDPTLGGLDGVYSSRVTSYSFDIVGTPDGPVAWAGVQFTVDVRLH